MEHEVWQIRQQDGLTEPSLTINGNKNDATKVVQIPISETAQYDRRVPLKQDAADVLKEEHGSFSYDIDESQGMYAKLLETTTFFVNMTPTLSQQEHKRLVRSQAMKAYHAKRRRKAALEEETQLITSMSLDYDQVVDSHIQDSFVSFPVEMAPTTWEFLHNEFVNGPNCGVAFYQTLANLANWVRLAGGTPDSLKIYMHEQEMQHTARALSLVREMLLDPKEQSSQGVVSAVTHLITYSIMNNDMVAAAYHLDGLERIINLRGGFETLDYDLQAYISWGEVYLATTWDSKPRFIAPVGYYKTITAFDAPLTPGSISIIKTLRQRHPSLAAHTDLFEQITRVNNVFQNEILNHRTLTSTDGNVHNGICYHLAAIVQPIDFDDESVVMGEIIRLSLLVYLLPVWQHIAGLSSGSFHAAQQLKKLRVAMEGNDIEWGRLISLKAWVVVMGFLNVIEADDVLFWSRLWIETQHELENRKVPPLFENLGLGLHTQENVAVGCLSLQAPRAVTSVIWLDNFHGWRYRETVSRMLRGD